MVEIQIYYETQNGEKKIDRLNIKSESTDILGTHIMWLIKQKNKNIKLEYVNNF